MSAGVKRTAILLVGAEIEKLNVEVHWHNLCGRILTKMTIQFPLNYLVAQGLRVHIISHDLTDPIKF